MLDVSLEVVAPFLSDVDKTVHFTELLKSYLEFGVDFRKAFAPIIRH